MYTLTDLMDNVFFPLTDRLFYEDYDNGKICKMMCYKKESTKVPGDTRRSYLRAILSKDIYNEISNYDGDAYGDIALKRTLIQKFCDAKGGEQVLSAEPLINKAVSASDGFFEAVFQRIKNLIVVSSYVQCVEDYEGYNLDSIKQRVDDNSFNANRNRLHDEISKKLSINIWPYIKKECVINEDVVPDNVEFFLTAVILFIIFNNKYYETKKWMNDNKKSAIKANIKKFIELKLYNGFLPENNADVAKRYNALLVKKLYKEKLRDAEDAIEGIISKIYVFQQFKQISMSTTKTPVSGSYFKSIIRGDSGLGKSLFSKLIALTLSITNLEKGDVEDICQDEWYELVEFADKCKKRYSIEDYVPIYIEAKNLNKVEDFSDVKSILLKKFLGYDNCDDLCKGALMSQKILFIIDGIDEISKDKRNCLCEHLANISPKDDNCSILVTSRKIPLNSISDFSKWEICEMDDPQVSEFIDKIGTTYEGFFSSLDKEWVKKAVFENKYLTTICKNPYFLIHTMLSFQKQRKNNDKNPAVIAVYTDITERLIDGRMKTHGIDVSDVEPCLTAIAREIYSQKNDEWSLEPKKTQEIIEATMTDAVKEIFPNNIKKFIDLLSHNSGLLAYNENGYAFLHDMFLCYYMAKGIAKDVQDKMEDLGFERHVKNFEFSAIRMAGPATVFRTLEERLDEELVKFAVIMALSLMANYDQAMLSIVEWLLYKSVVVDNEFALNNISEIFKDFLEETFGRNFLNENTKSKIERPLKQVIQKAIRGDKNEK